MMASHLFDTLLEFSYLFRIFYAEVVYDMPITFSKFNTGSDVGAVPCCVIL